ncbi:penicillin-binding protein PBP1A [Streptococcus sp. DD13]|uniref:penicillin-binding protein PBP1A n=1 Tax=Streptococcus sp. DD13 TaxID=1777881 RepID=UPI000835E060|nr:penicillin-binding protein PBP1A [Streptococcus sp. DD13]
MNKTLVKRIALIVANVFLSLFILGVVAFAGLVALNVRNAPALSQSALASTTSSKIYDKDNQLIADLGAVRRSNASTEEIPTDLVNAIVSIEDQRFFNHRGVDVIRIIGSFFNNVRGGSLQGGSTLDQQLIKLTYFSTSVSDQNVRRKIQEIWLALQLEGHYSKQEILTFYINKVYMSNGNYGMKTAANSYYGKELRQLSLAQLALLAGMPQAPNQYDPYTQPEAAKARRDLVLKEMRKEGYITQDQYQQAVDTPVTDGLISLKNDAAYPAYMDNYLKQVIEEVEDKTGYNLLTTGMDVYTNVDSAAQQRLWNIYNTSDYVNYPDDTIQVASTVIDVSNGKVVAQLGGRNQSSNSSFGTNQAVETNRDWGSTMKPISDYAPALEGGIYTSTGDTVTDEPYNYPNSSTPVYNWDRRYFGNITIKDALRLSRNVPAVKSLAAVGLENASSFLKSIGIEYPEMHYANAISSNTTVSSRQYGASSEKMAAAYAAFANGGTYYKPQYVNKIVFNDGTTTEYANKGTRVMTEETAFMMTDMLKSVMSYGYGVNANVDGIPMAGKTGTSNYSDDEYQTVAAEHPEVYSSSNVAPDENFVGYSTRYAMAVWTGYTNRNTPILDAGMPVASEVYHAMMEYLNPSAQATDWTAPDGLLSYGSYYYLRGSRPTNLPSSTISSSTEESSSEESSTSRSSSTSESSENDEKSEESSTANSTSTTPSNPNDTSSTDQSRGRRDDD